MINNLWTEKTNDRNTMLRNEMNGEWLNAECECKQFSVQYAFHEPFTQFGLIADASVRFNNVDRLVRCMNASRKESILMYANTNATDHRQSTSIRWTIDRSLMKVIESESERAPVFRIAPIRSLSGHDFDIYYSFELMNISIQNASPNCFASISRSVNQTASIETTEEKNKKSVPLFINDIFG